MRQPNDHERWQIYMRGWRDGAGRKPTRPNHADHPTLGVDYNRGYSDGREAHGNAATLAAARYDYEPIILRLAEEAGDG